MTNLHTNETPSSSSGTDSSSTNRTKPSVPASQSRRQVYPAPRINDPTNTQQLTVAVRIRPLNEEEKQKQAIECAFPLDNQV
ncbi:Kinesin-like protein [Aphelenchoides besseyi]|nr:Kinesin-like protein [Aphelenchoides besseyi]